MVEGLAVRDEERGRGVLRGEGKGVDELTLRVVLHQRRLVDDTAGHEVVDGHEREAPAW